MIVACGQPASPAAPERYDVITADQIEKSEAVNAYEVIQRLRPNFLASRGPTNLRDGAPTLPNVYVDDVPYGTIATLTTIAATDIAVIRMYTAGEATFKFGTGNVGGVIGVYTKH
jgi:hypothetical protein